MLSTIVPANTDERIDSRDLIGRMEELQARRDDEDQIDPLDEDEAAELVILEKVNAQGEGFSDWAYGATLIHEDHFADYVKETAVELREGGNQCERCGKAHKGVDLSEWPYSHIDWDAAADDERFSYSEIDFDGTTYLIGN